MSFLDVFLAVFSVFFWLLAWLFSVSLPASWCGFAGSCQFLVVFHGKALLFLAGFQFFLLLLVWFYWFLAVFSIFPGLTFQPEYQVTDAGPQMTFQQKCHVTDAGPK